ncbi:hypothetical protein B9Z19DRAFT_1103448 [Tuber borchii]|uniref:Berberine/berberine-like domain-containing protein n=1 Tax=Tuber borchii TaxID=42251 RepID=A0A2T6ZG29_TUBBO|nr:hypothetical protein B9Z19DRAFT_1103448 [Tuber borchii]
MTLQTIFKALAAVGTPYRVSVAALPAAKLPSLPAKILSIGTSNYTTINNDYYWYMFITFPASSVVLYPSCIVSRTSPQKVSPAVKNFTESLNELILNKENSYGLAIDNVKIYEVVLGNGTIIHANATSHSDLHHALERGGDNFDWIWGGMIYYNQSQLSQVDGVLYDYRVDIAVNDVKAYILPQFVLPHLYNGALNFTSPTLQPWVVDLAREFEAGFAYGFVQRTFTVYKEKQFFSDVELILMFNILVLGLIFNNLSDTDEVFPAFATFIESMMSLAKQRSVRHPYIMWSYVGHDEGIIEACGEGNNDFLRRIKEDYDPVGTFTNLVSGGCKLPAPGY